MYNYHSDAKIPGVEHEDIAKLLRCLGALGTRRGFDYTVYIVFQILQQPNSKYWATKLAYPETADHFHVRSCSVERAVRTMIGEIWDQYDHSDLDRVAGRKLENMPTNSEFFDILAAYLSYGAYPRDERYFRY